MIKFKNYYRPDTLEEAYALSQKKRHAVIGGMLWLKMSNNTFAGVIDLQKLGLDKIEEKEDEFSIGAMVTLRMLEKSEELNRYSRDAVKHAVEHIIGVQFRNLATIGGSLFGRYGFSDVLAVFLAMEAKVELYHGGIMTLPEFMKKSRREKDILVRVIVPKKKDSVVYLAHRHTATDFPTITVAVSKEADQVLVAVGGRPETAVVLTDETGILANGITEESAAALAQEIASKVRFRSNVKASAEYRQALCQVLVRRALLQL